MDRWDEIFDLLERPDKWFLGGGRAMLWAPEFPKYLSRPGFWDPGTWYHLPVGPLFTVTLLAENQRPLALTEVSRRWRVSHLVTTYESGQEFVVEERRSLSSEDVLVSEMEIKNNTPIQRTLDIVAWTAQPARDDRPGADFITNVRSGRDRIVIAHQVNDAKSKPQFIYCQALGSIRDPDSSCVNLSQGHGESREAVAPPLWEITPFSEKFAESGLPRQTVTKGGPSGALANWTVYVGMHYRLIVPAGTVRKFTAGMAIAKTGTDATRNLKRSLGVHSPADRSTRNWRSFFQTVPYFRCSDPYIERGYWYRWYGLRLNMVHPADYGPKNACVFEGTNPGWFRHAISYSAHAHMRELRWCHNRAFAEGSLLNFLDAQKKNGEMPAAVGAEFGPNGAKGMYHADWGRAVRELFTIHGNRNFLKNVYPGLAKYAAWMMKSRDKDKSGLFDVVNQWETGQEYSSRYQFADEKADAGREFRLKGVDATVYMYELFRALAWIAETIGKSRDVRKWTEAADATAQAVSSKMYDPALKMFTDTESKTFKRSPVKSAAGFYPFASDLARVEHLDAIHRNLLDPKAFWTEYPVPSLSLDDPSFSATGEWKRARMNCPWNGRSWLMSSSHVVEALAEAALNLDESLRVRASEMIRNFIRMTFIDRDVTRPTSYEYYNPLTGQAPFFRATDDYMHSWIVDLILRYVAGLRPGIDGSLTIDALPFGLKKLSIDNLKIRGKTLSIDMIAGRGRLMIGTRMTRFTIGKAATVTL